MKQTIYLEGKAIGTINGDTFTKKGQVFRLLNSIGNNMEIHNLLKEMDIEKVRVKIKSHIYETELNNFEKFGHKLQVTETHGEQIHLPLNHWRLIK